MGHRKSSYPHTMLYGTQVWCSLKNKRQGSRLQVCFNHTFCVNLFHNHLTFLSVCRIVSISFHHRIQVENQFCVFLFTLILFACGMAPTRNLLLFQ